MADHASIAPPWADPSATHGGPEALPSQVDVAIVGGGLAGLSAALFLAEGGARPVVLERRPQVGLGASGSMVPLATLGLLEHPFRLLHSLGEERAAQLMGFCRENLDLLEARGLLERTGAVWAAADAQEADHVARSAEALSSLGVKVQTWSPEEVAHKTGSPSFHGGFFVPEEGVAPPGAVQRLARSAQDAGARIFTGCDVQSVALDASGVRIVLPEGQLRADVVVFAAGAHLGQVDPSFEDTICPVREQCLWVDGLEPATPGRTQQGHFSWAPHPKGGAVFSGCRWATPHMEEAEPELRLVDRVQSFLERAVKQRFTETVAIRHRWAYIRAGTGDGLPLVGPLPGSVRQVACTGFGGNDLAFAMRAGRAVADGLLHGQPIGVPADFSPGRFVL